MSERELTATKETSRSRNGSQTCKVPHGEAKELEGAKPRACSAALAWGEGRMERFS